MPMDCHRGSAFHVANVVRFQSGNSRNGVNENGGLGPVGKAYWNAEEAMSDKETSVHTNLKSNYNRMPFQLELESEPPRKRVENGLLEGGLTTLDHKKATDKVLYKTRLCYQFRAGSCPCVKDCDFAHSMEELRELPHNWQDIVAAHKDEQMESSEQPREVIQIPIVGFNEETQGPNLRQHCKNFSTSVGCQFGENCNSIHNYEERKSVAICLLPGPGGGCIRSGSKSNPGTEDGYESNGSKLTLNASNRKTRICNKSESTGFCAYGKTYPFAHGYAEMQHYGGRLANGEAIASVGAAGAPVSHVPYSYRVGVPPRRLPAEVLRTGDIPIRRWKGPDKISKIYGDWIDDL